MKTQFLVNVITNGMHKKGTLEILDDKIVLFIDNAENKISFENVKGGYISNGIFEIILQNDMKMSLECFEEVNNIYSLFEEKKNKFDEKNFFHPKRKKDKGDFKKIFKSIFLSILIVGCVVALLEYYKYQYDRRLIIVSVVFLIIISVISQILSKKNSLKMNLGSDDLIDAVMGILPNGQKILNEYSTGIIVDYGSGEFCIIKKPFSSYDKYLVSNIISSEIVLNGDEHNCNNLFIKLVILDNGIQKNEFIPLITKKISKNSNEFKSVYEFTCNLNKKFQEFINRYQSDGKVLKVEPVVNNNLNQSSDETINIDDWSI